MDKLFSTKRDRSVNFSREETEKLVALVEAKKYIVENTESNAITWQDKAKAWKEIENEYNSAMGTIFRSTKNLKLKYESLKRDTRRKLSLIEQMKSSGEPGAVPSLTLIEERVKRMIMYSVEGDDSAYDTDPIVRTDNTENIEETTDNLYFVAVNGEAHNDIINNIKVELEEEPEVKRKCLEPNTTLGNNTSNTRDVAWENVAIENEHHPASSCKPNEKSPSDESRVALQNELLQEEIRLKKIQRQMLEDEREHKSQMYYLEKQHMLLKIEILKKEL